MHVNLLVVMMNLSTVATLGVHSHLQLSLYSGVTLGSSCSYLDDELVYRYCIGSALLFSHLQLSKCSGVILGSICPLILMMSLCADITWESASASL